MVDLQSCYLQSKNINLKGLTGDSWVKIISTTILTLWLELWDTRKKDRHGAESNQKSKLAHEQAIREMTILYSYQTQVLQRNRHIFDRELPDQVLGDTRYLRQRINTNQAVILKSTKSAKFNCVLNVRTISSYFDKRPKPK